MIKKQLFLVLFTFICLINNITSQTNGCGSPTVLPVNASCTNQAFAVNQNNSNQEIDASCATAGTAYSDAWFIVTGTGNTMTITITGSNRALVLAAFTGCATGEIAGACDIQSAGVTASISFPTTNLTTYYIQIQRRSGNTTQNLNGNICAVSAPAAGGSNYNMSTSSETTCTGTFYDPGNTGNYGNNELYTMTFTPDAPCSYLQFVFSSFSTESGYDDLTIYDGPDAGSPLIGTYDGTNSPGTVTATNSAGQLTFVWDSDGSNVDAGWVASISCIAGSACSGTPNAGTAAASPTSIDCSTTSSTISATGLTDDCDITYQWQSSPDNATWTDIPGETGTSFSASPSSNTYYQLVTTCANGGATNNSSSVLLSSTLTAPSNDECATATSLTVNADYNCGTTTAGTVECASASADANGCFGTSNDDVWYSFVATQTNHRISLLNIAGSETDMYHGIYSGTCGSLTELNCNDGNTTNMTGLSIGTTYYVRVYNYYGGAENTTFDICIGGPPPPPSNDEPCNAIAATVNPDLLCGSVTGGYTLQATNSGVAACVGSGADDDVWFSFVATNTTHNFDLLNITGTSTDLVMEIFSGACGSISSIACSDPESAQFNGFTIGTTYHIRVYTYYTGDNASFDLCIGTPPPAPSNDEPCGALTLTVNNGSCSYQAAMLGTSTTTSTGMPAPGCGSLGPDIWYQFTVPASGRIIIDISDNGGPTDIDMAWYTSSTNDCNNLDVVVECDDSDSQNGSMAMICHAGASCVVPGDCEQNGTLTPGETVWVRLWEYGGTPFGGFDICAYDPGAPGAASNCGNATVITGMPYNNSGATTCCRGNTYDATDGCLSSYQDGEDFLYEYTPAANETIDITLTGTESYTGVFITDNCPSAGGVNCIASQTETAGNPALCGVSLTGGTTYYIMVDTDPNPDCTPFNINMSTSTTPTCGLNYTKSNIGYAPALNAGTNIALPIDDRFSSSYVPIGFDFCFDGYQFTQCLISSNGYIVFDAIGCTSNLPTTNAAPGNTSGYTISAAIPNTTNAPRNSILFPWQDIDPSLGGTIKYQTIGTSPNQIFVVTFDQIPYFSCNSLLFTGQVKLYETTNDIEMHIGNKEDCSGWNSGASILGLHNYDGSSAVIDVNYPTTNSYSNRARKFTYNCPGPCVVILPVKLVEFSGKSNDGFNEVYWSTATETNNDYFLLESSPDGINFTEIGTFNGAGNSNSMNYYSTKHNNPNDLEYYRLKQVDFDGQYEYSNIIAINSNKDINVNIYPNPAKDKLFFNLSTSNDDTYTIIYTNVLGSAYIEQIDITQDNNLYEVKEFNKLSPGIYFVQILNGNSEVIKTKKIVKE